MSRPAVASALGARAAQAGPSRIRPQSIPPTASTSSSHPPRPPPKDPPKPIQYARAPPGIVQIPHPALDPSLGLTRLYIQISNNNRPSLVHLFAVSRAIEAHYQTPVVSVDANINPEIISPYTAFFITLLRPVTLDKPLTLLTRQPEVTAKDMDIHGPSLHDIRSVLDSPAEVEDVFGEPGPLAGLEQSSIIQFQVSPAGASLPSRDRQNQQTMDHLPKKLQDQRLRMRQEKQAEDMKIYAVVEQLARSSQGEFDNVLMRFRHLKPAAGPDAERVAKELALLRHREMEEQAPKPGWAFSLDQQVNQAAGPVEQAGGKPLEKRSPKKGFSLSALSSSVSSEDTTGTSSPDEANTPAQQPDSRALPSDSVAPTSHAAKTILSKASSSRGQSPSKAGSRSRQTETSRAHDQQPIAGPTSAEALKLAREQEKQQSIALQLARKKEQDRLDAEARALKQREIDMKVDELGAQAARERAEEAQSGWIGAIKGLLKGK